MADITISLLDISGPVDENTPLIVLEEISNAHDISFPYFHSSNVVPFTINPSLLTIEDQMNAIKLINKNITWNLDELKNSFEFISLFRENPFYSTDNTDFGLSTPENPYCYNSSMCYRLLREKNLVIHRFCTFRELSNAVLVAYRHASYGRTILYSLLSNMESEDLSSVYLHGLNKRSRFEEPYDRLEDTSSDENEENDETIDELTYQTLKHIPDLYSDDRYLLIRIDPSTDAEAIFLAATNFETDISRAKNPQEEYNILRRDPTQYIPKDPILKEIVRKSPLILKLNYFFNPYLPSELYSERNLTNMATFEGYREEDFAEEDSYSLLQTSCFSDTFHTGIFFNIKNTVTLEYENVSEMPINILVYFGNPREELYVFRIRELDKIFRKERVYKNPLDGSLFSELSIRKLRNICSLVFPQDVEDTWLERRSLIGTIDFIEIYNAGNMQKLRELYERFETSNQKEQIRKVIVSFTELGMYMRGWEGSGEYPLEICIVRNQINTDLLVTTAIYNFERECLELGDIGDLIINLPLLRFYRGNFVASNNQLEGRTIKERLEIVKGGENNHALFSCIRLTSNWICATAYRIMQTLKMVPTFNIEKMREIS